MAESTEWELVLCRLGGVTMLLGFIRHVSGIRDVLESLCLCWQHRLSRPARSAGSSSVYVVIVHPSAVPRPQVSGCCSYLLAELVAAGPSPASCSLGHA